MLDKCLFTVKTTYKPNYTDYKKRTKCSILSIPWAIHVYSLWNSTYLSYNAYIFVDTVKSITIKNKLILQLLTVSKGPIPNTCFILLQANIKSQFVIRRMRWRQAAEILGVKVTVDIHFNEDINKYFFFKLKTVWYMQVGEVRLKPTLFLNYIKKTHHATVWVEEQNSLAIKKGAMGGSSSHLKIPTILHYRTHCRVNTVTVVWKENKPIKW